MTACSIAMRISGPQKFARTSRVTTPGCRRCHRHPKDQIGHLRPLRGRHNGGSTPGLPRIQCFGAASAELARLKRDNIALTRRCHPNAGTLNPFAVGEKLRNVSQ